jgi:hypothetical protein
VIYAVTVTATRKTIVAFAGAQGYVLDESSLNDATQVYAYTTEAASSSEVIDRVFAELEQVGATPAGVRVSVRPVEAVKP